MESPGITVENNSDPQVLKELIKEAEQRLQYQRDAFDALLTISQSLGESPGIELVFKQAIQPIQKITGFNTIALRLYDRQLKRFTLRAEKGFSPLMYETLIHLPRPVDEIFMSQMIASKKAVIRNVSVSESADFRNVVFIPLLGNDQIVGSMDLGSKTERFWTDDEISWLELIGKYLGMIIHQIQLTEKLEGMSALQERERLAQELHDETVQLISAQILWSQDAQMNFSEGNFFAAQEAMHKIEQNANTAYKSLREEIFGLRKRVEADEDIISVIQSTLDIFRNNWGIITSFHYQGDPYFGNPLKLPIRTELQLLRIIQEALTNVRKHASARRVDLSLQISADWIRVNIQDDGHGFDPGTIPSDHLGLRIMRERANSLGGTVEIDSCIGCGSQIKIELPR